MDIQDGKSINKKRGWGGGFLRMNLRFRHYLRYLRKEHYIFLFLPLLFLCIFFFPSSFLCIFLYLMCSRIFGRRIFFGEPVPSDFSGRCPFTNMLTDLTLEPKVYKRYTSIQQLGRIFHHNHTLILVYTNTSVFTPLFLKFKLVL